MDAALAGFQRALVKLARRHRNTLLPGYTHLQRAQPILLAHHLLAYREMLARDRARFRDCRARADELPLGAGALAGAGFALDGLETPDDPARVARRNDALLGEHFRVGNTAANIMAIEPRIDVDRGGKSFDGRRRARAKSAAPKLALFYS